MTYMYRYMYIPAVCFLAIAGIYLTCMMAITTLSMVLTVLVLNLHHISDRPVPFWLKKLTLVYLARAMCMCSYSQYAVDHKKAQEELRTKYRFVPNKNLGRVVGSQVGLMQNLNGVGGTAEQKEELLKTTTTTTASTTANTPLRQPGAEFGYRFSLDDSMTSEEQVKADRKKLEEQYAKDWRHVAEVMDRLFFWLFFLSIIVSTMVLFHPLSTAYFKSLTSGVDEPQGL